MCDQNVTVSLVLWQKVKDPFATCEKCREVPIAVRTQFYKLRCQVRHLYDALRSVKQDVNEVYEAYGNLIDS